MTKHDEVASYLRRHPDMAPVLRTASTATLALADAGAQVSLELYRDPEIDDEYLVLFVRHEDYDDCILDAIDAVAADYEAALANASGWLVVTTDFQNPVRGVAERRLCHPHIGAGGVDMQWLQ